MITAQRVKTLMFGNVRTTKGVDGLEDDRFNDGGFDNAHSTMMTTASMRISTIALTTSLIFISSESRCVFVANAEGVELKEPRICLCWTRKGRRKGRGLERIYLCLTCESFSRL